MESRMEKKSKRKNKRGTRLKNASAIMLCIVFFISAIYLADVSTRRMMLCKDDKYAIGLSGTGTDVLRVDLVGEHYLLNYSQVKKISSDLLKESEKTVKTVITKVKSKIDD